MKKLIASLYWRYLEHKKYRLIPAAYFDEKKRIKLCRIDEKIIKLKRNTNGKRKKIFLAETKKRFF